MIYQHNVYLLIIINRYICVRFIVRLHNYTLHIKLSYQLLFDETITLWNSYKLIDTSYVSLKTVDFTCCIVYHHREWFKSNLHSKSVNLLSVKNQHKQTGMHKSVCQLCVPAFFILNMYYINCQTSNTRVRRHFLSNVLPSSLINS